MICTKRVLKSARGFRYEVVCGGRVVACGERSTRELARTAADRELAVFKRVNHLHTKAAAKKRAPPKRR